MLHNAKDSTGKLAPVAHQHVSARSQHWVREHAAHAEAARGHHQSGPHATTTAALEHQQPRCAMLKLRRPPCFSQLCAAQRARSAAPGGPMACPASREAEAGRVSASCAGGHAPRTGEREWHERVQVAHAFA